MRAVFAGTPEFAAVAVRQLLAAGHEITLVLTQPDRPAGRGMALQQSAVKQLALRHQLPLQQPRSLRLNGRFATDAVAAQDAIRQAGADVMVVAAYGLLLPQWVLDAFSAKAASTVRAAGCLNIHGSLLPRWRGAAPVQRAIEAGDAVSGVCIMQMDAGLDTGAVLLSAQIPIRHEGVDADTGGSLHDRLAILGAGLIVQALASVGTLAPRPQPSDGVCYARKVDKSQACIDWALPPALLERRIRAFDPAPGAWTTLHGQTIKVWRAAVLEQEPPPAATPGTLLRATDQGIDVACGSGAVRLLELQRAGGRRMPIAEFVRGQTLPVGQQFDSPAA